MEELNQIAGPRVQDLISVLYFLMEQKSQMKRGEKNEYQQY